MSTPERSTRFRFTRLFWKFFAFFWLAQMLTGMLIGLLINLEHRNRPPPEPPPWAVGPPGEGFARPGGPPPHRSHLLPPPIPLIAGSVVSLLFAFGLAWYFAKPIRTLRNAFEKSGEGRLDFRVGPKMGERRDELADLGRDFDRMADRLQQILEGQRRLLHDVSHELRSPLARLSTAVDLMQQQPERAAECVQRLGQESGRLNALVGELLTLARLDSAASGGPLLRHPVDLPAMLGGLADDAEFESNGKQCKVLLDIAPDIEAEAGRLPADADLLHRALENILRNAIRYSPDAGQISIRASRAEAGVHENALCIAVTDQGPGVAPELLDAIFQPFSRYGADRTDGNGYGLGLAIVRRIVARHGGTVRAFRQSETPPCGLRVEVILPLS